MKRAGYKCYSAGDSDGRVSVNAWAICIIFGASQLALSAINTQSAASSSMATIIVFGTSCASSACTARRTTESNTVHFYEAHYCQPTSDCQHYHSNRTRKL